MRTVRFGERKAGDVDAGNLVKAVFCAPRYLVATSLFLPNILGPYSKGGGRGFETLS